MYINEGRATPKGVICVGGMEMHINEVDPEFCKKECCEGRHYDKHGCRCESVDNQCEHPSPRKKSETMQINNS